MIGSLYMTQVSPKNLFLVERILENLNQELSPLYDLISARLPRVKNRIFHNLFSVHQKHLQHQEHQLH